MSIVLTSLSARRDLRPATQSHGSVVIRLMIRGDNGCRWAESPELPGLSVAEKSRNSLLSAISPAVEYSTDETSDLRSRPVAGQITIEHVGPAGVWTEARTA